MIWRGGGGESQKSESVYGPRYTGDGSRYLALIYFTVRNKQSPYLTPHSSFFFLHSPRIYHLPSTIYHLPSTIYLSVFPPISFTLRRPRLPGRCPSNRVEPFRLSASPPLHSQRQRYTIMEALIQRLSSPAIAVPVLLLLFYYLYKRLTSVSNIPADLPCISKDPSKVSADIRATLASFSSAKDWLELGYNKVARLMYSICCPS